MRTMVCRKVAMGGSYGVGHARRLPTVHPGILSDEAPEKTRPGAHRPPHRTARSASRRSGAVRVPARRSVLSPVRGEGRRRLDGGSPRRAHSLALVLRPAPVGVTRPLLERRYEILHGHGGPTPMRSTCTET